jgi:uncharacterized SAM-binding protein YcdF (DUF218 family)
VRTKSVTRGRRLSRLTWLIVAGLAVVILSVLWAVAARAFAPSGNTTASRFDAIIVLGAAIDRDGNPTPILLSRVTEGVREYERGVAPRLIVSGGPDRDNYVQANVMARVAEAQGVPRSAIVLESNAENTIENACFSSRLMKQNGWQSAEVVTTSEHLPRTGLIFNKLPIAWRGHAAPSLSEPSAGPSWDDSANEVLHTDYYLLFSQWVERCSP